MFETWFLTVAELGEDLGLGGGRDAGEVGYREGELSDQEEGAGGTGPSNSSFA